MLNNFSVKKIYRTSGLSATDSLSEREALEWIRGKDGSYEEVLEDAKILSNKLSPKKYFNRFSFADRKK